MADGAPPRHVVRTGTLGLPVAPDVALPFFTPAGERAWAPGWEPEYVHPADGTMQSGLVFRTSVGGERTTWLVLRWDPERHEVDYLRAVPESRIGVVSIRCRAAGLGATEVQVTYALTALSEAGERTLAAFTDDVVARMLADWEAAITRLIADAAGARDAGRGSPAVEGGERR